MLVMSLYPRKSSVIHPCSASPSFPFLPTGSWILLMRLPWRRVQSGAKVPPKVATEPTAAIGDSNLVAIGKNSEKLTDRPFDQAHALWMAFARAEDPRVRVDWKRWRA